MQSPNLPDSKTIRAILGDGRLKEAVERLQFSAEQQQWLPVAFAARQLSAKIRGLDGEIWQTSRPAAEALEVERQRLTREAEQLFQQFKAWEKDPAAQAKAFDTAHREKIDLFLLAIKIRREGKALEAIRVFTQVIHKEPAFTEAYIERAALLMQQPAPDWGQALEDLNTALRISPNHPLALTNRGYLYVHFYQDLPQACADWKAVQHMGFPIADALIEQHCKNR
jgi:tetratricopeptide (TPR) repeat protein